MGAVAQVDSRNRYERTRDEGKMLTSAQLTEAIITAVRRQKAGQEPETNILNVLPARAATSMRYDKGARNAFIRNEGGKEERIDLPLEDSWRVSDGNPFGVPNGKPSTSDNPDALYLIRNQNVDFSGPVGLGDYFGCGRRRGFDADGDWSNDSGVALVGRPEVQGTLGASDRRSLDEATTQMVELPVEKLVKVADPQTLREDAAKLRQIAENLQERFKGWDQALTEVVKPVLD